MHCYDFLVVGSGLFGAVFAYRAKKQGKKCLVIDIREHIAGNVYTEKCEGIDVHKYGAHIFHTNDDKVWKFITQFGDFNNFINCPVANFKGKLYNLPFNMNTFYQMWGVTTPELALKKIEEQRKEAGICDPVNLEEQAISLVGKDIYETLIKGYTEKQWGRKCSELPVSIIKRLPFRLTFDNNYFNAKYQGIPVDGYTSLVNKMLEGIDVRLKTDYFDHKAEFDVISDKVIFTGAIDRYFDYCFGPLEYRRVRFENEVLDMENYQGVAAMNFTEAEIPYTRIIEHKHFVFGTQPKTVISREYPAEWKVGEEPYYPINNSKNQSLYLKYKYLADKQDKVIFGGRLGSYKYYDMDKVIAEALEVANKYI